MGELIIKGKLDQNDIEEIRNLQTICLEVEQIALKLELDFKASFAETSVNQNNCSEFMYYYSNKLVAYMGICSFGNGALEVNGMVHPDYRRQSLFTTLFSAAEAEWQKRTATEMLLLSDHNSMAGLEFIKGTGAMYHHSEYEMILNDDVKKSVLSNNVMFRRAKNKDAREVASQNAIYFIKKFTEVDLPCISVNDNSVIFIAEVEGQIVGKVHVEIYGGVGGIYGLGVYPAYRGRGYGREILTHAIEWLQAKKVTSTILQVSVININALTLYTSCGFRETSTMDYFLLKK
ncbi:MAG: GNAT family N-acetyltransferase [Firmicutes bacterium]|nr:GNAT family N-acetyltransferase [Bacillota bacterium]